MVHTKPMRRHLLLLAALGAFIVGGCAAPRPAWPDGYRQAICAATDHLRAADAEFAAAVDGIASADADRVAIAASGMERESVDALDLLGRARPLDAGAQLTAELLRATTDFADAAGEFGVGARQDNGPALDRAVAAAQDAAAALARADLEGQRLRSALGWQPC